MTSRYSPSLSLIEKLSTHGCTVHTYDPKAILPLTANENIIQHEKLEQALKGAECVIIATDWDEFKHLDWDMVKKLMKGNLIMDARNCIDPKMVKQAGLQYIGVAGP